jgi:hypothetical protein
VLECVTPGWTDTHMVVLHPRDSWIRYKNSGQVFLASAGHQPLAGLEISEAMSRHLQGTRVREHGGDHRSRAPSDKDLATALIVNHTPRITLSLPRSVRLYAGGPVSTLNCGWTPMEWDDFETEVDQGLHSPETLSGLQRRRSTMYHTPEDMEQMNYGENQL